MAMVEETSKLLDILNRAVARELQVSIQYMIQHSILNAQMPDKKDKTASEKQDKFVGTHFPFWLPGTSLKKIAIEEMRHAEQIAERVVTLGGVPTTEPKPITLGDTSKEMLEINKKAESSAIGLYKSAIKVAERENDEVTKKLFVRILSEEENHFKTFSELLEKH
jgi:bacterioferritin